MTPQLAALALIFLTTVTVAIILLAPLVVFYRRVDERNPNPPGRIFGVFTPTVGSFLPSTAGGRETIRKLLLLAGHYRTTAQQDYYALRAVLTITPLIVFWLLGLLAPGKIAIAFFLLGLALAGVGFSWPRLILQMQGSKREDEIRRGLPMFMDTLGLVLSSGATLTEGMLRAADAIERGYPELAREVRVVVSQAKLRSMSHALDAWRDRLPIPELGSLVFLLSQSDRQGTDITRGLWELSTSFQTSTRQRAEAAANRANFHMLFPTVLCLMIAAGILLIGPGIVLLQDARTELNRALEEANRNQKEAARPAPMPKNPPPPQSSSNLPILTP